MFDGATHDVGLSPVKRRLLFQSLLYILLQPQPIFGCIERGLGKWGFSAMFCPCTRAIIGAAYKWICAIRAMKVHRVKWQPVVWGEVLFAAMLLPFQSFNLAAPWASRVVCSDASPGGHGQHGASRHHARIVSQSEAETLDRGSYV